MCSYRNFDLFYDILTKEKDETFKFKNMLLIARNNLHSIYKEYEVKEFDSSVKNLVERNMIKERKIFLPSPKKEKEHGHPSQPGEDHNNRSISSDSSSTLARYGAVDHQESEISSSSSASKNNSNNLVLIV